MDLGLRVKSMDSFDCFWELTGIFRLGKYLHDFKLLTCLENYTFPFSGGISIYIYI